MDTPRVSHGPVQVGACPPFHVNQFGLGQRCGGGIEIAMAHRTRPDSRGQPFSFPGPFPSVLQEKAFGIRAHSGRANRSRNPVVHQRFETGDDRVPQPGMGFGRHKIQRLQNQGQTRSVGSKGAFSTTFLTRPNLAFRLRKLEVIVTLHYAD